MRAGFRKLIILAEGAIRSRNAKTAFAVLRFAPSSVTAVVDSETAGTTCEEALKFGGSIPILSDIEQAIAATPRPEAILLGTAPPGGALPDRFAHPMQRGLEAGLNVASGLHVWLADDPAFAAAALRGGAKIWDLRRPPARLSIAGPLQPRRARVLLMAGSDCNVGKMTAGLLLRDGLRSRGKSAELIATGQTGLFLTGNGFCVDALPGDFMSGCTREAIKAIDDTEPAPDWIIVEGQGSLCHPAFSGVSLALLHGSAPDAILLCHEAGRRTIAHSGDLAMPPLASIRTGLEAAAAWQNAAPVIGVALRSEKLNEDEARRACASIAGDLNLPATDPLRFGSDPLIDAIEEAEAKS